MDDKIIWLGAQVNEIAVQMHVYCLLSGLVILSSLDDLDI